MDTYGLSSLIKDLMKIQDTLMDNGEEPDNYKTNVTGLGNARDGRLHLYTEA